MNELIDDVRRFGVPAAVHRRMYWRLNERVGYRAFAVIGIRLQDLARAELLEVPDGYEARFLDPAELRAIAEGHEDLRADNIDQFVARGDRCYGLLHGDEIAAYGWYSTAPTPFCDRAAFGFARGWVYMHQGFTTRSHRGKRLHGIGMARALREFDREGKEGLISLVETYNAPSLRSCNRMGYRRSGTLRIWGPHEHFHSRVSAACARAGVRVIPRVRQPEESETEQAAA